MSPFLRAAEARALAMREERIASTPPKLLHCDNKPPGRKASLEERLAIRRAVDAEREARIRTAARMRGEGLTWEEIGIALRLTPTQRDTTARAVYRRAQR